MIGGELPPFFRRNPATVRQIRLRPDDQNALRQMTVRKYPDEVEERLK
jgi:hypothetical protein